MSDLTTQTSGGALQQHVPPEERGYRLSALEAAEKHAEKIGDLVALRECVETRLAYLLETWRDYTATFPASQDMGRQIVTPHKLKPADWCKKLARSQSTVQRWKKLADEEARTAIRDSIVSRAVKQMDMEEAANFSSESNEWYTPAPYIAAVRALYGGAIDLDPATSPKANETVQAAQIFTIEDDALQHPWHGRAFLNPPYGKDGQESMAGKFCRYAIRQHEIGNLEACVILVNSVHSQKWQSPLYDWPVCFVDHRIQFVNGDGLENKSPTFQNILVYVGGDVPGFVEHFSPFGYVMGRIA